jgi:hypothetical protein
MFNKKMICLTDGNLIGIKFGEDIKTCIVGGQENLRERMENILLDFFGFENEDVLPKFIISTKSKGKYTFPFTWEKYMKAVNTMRESNFTVIDVKIHGRLMR